MSEHPSHSAEQDRPTGVTAVLVWPFVMVVRLYQRLISPLLPPTCRFYPSCSAYAVTALRRHGPFVGTWLTMKRLVRCHPWNPGGVDHVPPKKSSASAVHTNVSGETTSAPNR